MVKSKVRRSTRKVKTRKVATRRVKTRRVKTRKVATRRAKPMKKYTSKSAKYTRGKGKTSTRNLKLDAKRKAKTVRGKNQATWRGDAKGSRI